MKIINSMFSRGLGGIEQAFVDYTEALASRNHEVICLIRFGAKIETELLKLKQKFPAIKIKKIPNYFGKIDIVSKYLLNKILKSENTDCIIAHGNRPCALFARCSNKKNLIGVVHNYWFKDILKSDYLFCVSNDIRNKLILKYFQNDRVFVVPNLIKIANEPEFKEFSKPPIIGMMARMVEKKGVDVFIKACGILKNKNVKFSAVIGGDGILRNKYQTLRDDLKLNDNVHFIGWVKDKEKFYNDINIFCLPSLSEPFGIVLLEAATRKKPIVATRIEGPAEILNDNCAILVEKGNAENLAAGLEELVLSHEKSRLISEKNYKNIKESYDLAKVSEILEKAIESVLSKS